MQAKLVYVQCVGRSDAMARRLDENKAIAQSGAIVIAQLESVQAKRVYVQCYGRRHAER